MSRLRIVIVFLAIFPLSGCLWRSHVYKPTASTAPLKTATQAELIDYINAQAAKVQSMNATVDIDTTVGGAKKGKAIIVLNPAEPPMLMRDTVFTLSSGASEDQIEQSILAMIEKVQAFAISCTAIRNGSAQCV